MTTENDFQDEFSESVDTLARRNLLLRLLNRASQVLTSTIETEQVLERLLQIAVEIIGAYGSSVWLWHDVHSELLVCRAAFHSSQDASCGDKELLIGQTLQPGQGVAGWAALTGQSTIVNQAQTDERFYAEIDRKSGFHTTSLLAVPIRYRDVVIGVLEVINKYEGAFSEEDLTVVESLAASASIAIENAQMVEALRQQKQDLQAQNEELDAFAHTVAHNLKSPLSRLAGFAELLLVDEEHFSREEKQDMTVRIINNAYRMNNIVDELLLLSSVRKADVTQRPLDMKAIVAATLEQNQHLIDEYQATIHLPDSWPTALGHAQWIEEVWANYLSNALKYGGRPPIIELGAQAIENGKVQFWIRDNGAGIPEEQQAFLFTPFTRLSEVRLSGYGLGLSIVQRIIHKLGGSVGLESELGQGSLFYFTLSAA
ncbi:MAG: hybrid sensor histidine kinase/response regulator [Chloroflexi bacterium]|nr:MAG: hybrid sensor histidine kinase/response regulator [Chloroflexota bacterium]PIE81524.1 MAG: hybrid sensor histidine kinase/response regulator [Chloroflexota bacterium]